MSDAKELKVKVILKCPTCDHQEIKEFVCPECESYMHVEEQLEDAEDIEEVIEDKEVVMSDGLEADDDLDDADLDDLKDFTITDEDENEEELDDPYKVL
ncbi:hypothetical protein KC660_01905 [Candidatus Dojkabacteria bacterium]|uniref:Uncharacterized protein n=1 Tax=Candidatus Dojkabacteria bacterium TaxID=2099670 RepID=A0A955L3D6_9BACT|nr:hypothetical protein [Candidatus Dojkabacteria bacterium]